MVEAYLRSGTRYGPIVANGFLWGDHGDGTIARFRIVPITEL